MQGKGVNIIPGLFRTEYGKILATLCSRFSQVELEVLEDVLSDTFFKAMQVWPHMGVPKKPQAWLYTVSKNAVLSYLRSKKTTDVPQHLGQDADEPDFTKAEMDDSQLKMILAVCSTDIGDKAKIALVLNVLCGFSPQEIAAALLTERDTVYKNLQRSKAALKDSLVLSEYICSAENMDVVLHILYLLFNEGYRTAVSDTVVKHELCFEAMQLLYFLLQYPEVANNKSNALMALMCYQASRIDARLKDDRQLLYHKQDVSLWNGELIQKGDYYLQKCIGNTFAERYTIEASIAYWHAHPEVDPEKWEYILKLYALLIPINQSPVVVLNYVYAYSKVYDSKSALKILYASQVPQDHYYYTLAGVLLKEDNPQEAIKCFQAALVTARDKQVIEGYINEILYD
ncbi:RNA polymerase sigma factor [Flavobacterium sp. RHBU_3]|uniref:RNA polymerase sigma factor n=1 Tax=Flavobacterium sp. RHBU_3 TaxID=3391184 RepID=UPI003984CFE5